MQPLRLLYALHFVFWQRRCTEICLQIAVHFPAQKRMQICGQFSTFLAILPGGKALTKLQRAFGTQLVQHFLVRTAEALRRVLCHRSNELLHLQIELLKGFRVAAEILPVQFFVRHKLSPPHAAPSVLLSWASYGLTFALHTAERIQILGC